MPTRNTEQDSGVELQAGDTDMFVSHLSIFIAQIAEADIHPDENMKTSVRVGRCGSAVGMFGQYMIGG